jgi:hypothetical protein
MSFLFLRPSHFKHIFLKTVMLETFSIVWIIWIGFMILVVGGRRLGRLGVQGDTGPDRPCPFSTELREGGVQFQNQTNFLRGTLQLTHTFLLRTVESRALETEYPFTRSVITSKQTQNLSFSTPGISGISEKTGELGMRICYKQTGQAGYEYS